MVQGKRSGRFRQTSSIRQRQEADEIVEDATYCAIGRFIDSFSSIELTLRYYLAIEVKLDLKYYNSVITHDFALLCTAVNEVFGQTLETEEKKKELKKLIGQARKLNDLRVKIVHGMWWPDFEGGTLLHVSRQNLKEHQFAEMATHLERQVNLAHELFWNLQILLGHIEGPPGGFGRALAIAKSIKRLRVVDADQPANKELNQILDTMEAIIGKKK